MVEIKQKSEDRMGDNIARNKSQRWVSASKANYDGADWDAYSSNSEDEDNLDKQPPLPNAANLTNMKDEGSLVSLEPVSSNSKRSASRNTSVRSGNKSVNEDLDSLMHQISQEMTPQHSDPNVSSDMEDEFDSELKVSKTGYFAAYVEDEDSDVANSSPSRSNSVKQHSLTNNISIEQVQAKPAEKDVVISDENADDKEAASSIADADGHHNEQETKLTNDEPQHMKQQEIKSKNVELEVNEPKDVEQQNLDNQNVESQELKQLDEENPEAEQKAEQKAEEHIVNQADSYDYNNRSKDLESNDSDSLLNDYGSESSSPKKNTKSDFVLRKTSKTDLSYYEAYSSDESDEQTGGNAPFSAVSYGKQDSNSAESFKFRNRVRDSVLDSSDDDLDYSDNDDELKVANEGYFANIVKEEEEGEGEEVNDQSDAETIKSKSFESDSAKPEPHLDTIDNGKSDIPEDHGLDSEESEEDLNDVNSITNSITKSLDETSLKTSDDTKHQFGAGGMDIEYSDSSDEEDDRSSDMLPSTRESINLGKWKPDTDAFRSGFVTETIDVNNPPEGYVVNENGEIVEESQINASSVQRSATVTSDSESRFEAFPHDQSVDDEDIRTIADTKTIYDNQTLYNVPAVIANNVSAPALPTNIKVANESSDFISSDDTILKHVNGEKPQMESKLKESFKQEGDEFPAAHHKTQIPELNLVQLIDSKEPHSQKLRKLREYNEQLKEYDTGLQGWINYALKSSTNADKDFIFKDYKVNKHVQDAYAQADVLSKKNSVANTVNQNVTHLKKKMFSSSMREKSKGLFSSIGKKL